MKKLKFSLTIGLVPFLIIINYLNPSNIVFEKYYSNLLYPLISEKLRLITGWVVFPVGDVLYLFIAISLIYFIISDVNNIFNKIINLGSSIFILTFLFYILWGFNYKRITIKDKLNIKNEFDKKELVNFTENLINKINDKHELLFIHDSVKPKNIYSFEKNIQTFYKSRGKIYSK